MNENNGNKKYESYYSRLTGFNRAVPIILAALAVFVAVCFITDGTGVLGDGIGAVLIGLFSAGAYAIPALLVIHAIFYAEDIAEKRLLSRVIFSVIALLTVSVVEYAIIFFGKDYVFAPVEFFKEGTAGGFIGSIFAFVLINVLGPVGIIILAAALVLVYITYFFSKRTNISNFFISALGAVCEWLARVEGFFKKIFKGKKKERQTRKEKEARKRSAELLDDPFFEVDNGMKELCISELGIHEKRKGSVIEENPVLQESVRHKSAVDGEPTVISFGGAEQRRSPDHSYIDAVKGAAVNADEPSFRAGDTFENVSSVKPKEVSATEENADAVFTKDFDPYDFMNAEKLASRPSSKVQQKSFPTGISINERPLSSVSPEELEKERRREEFERKKQQIIAERKRREEALRVNVSPSGGVTVTEEQRDTPINAPTVDFADNTVGVSTEVKTAELSFGKKEEKSPYAPELIPRSVEIKLENKAERIQAEPVESGRVSLTFEKGESTVDGASEAEKIAEIVAMNNPAYRRSFNATSVRMEIREGYVGNSAPSASEAAVNNVASESAFTESSVYTAKAVEEESPSETVAETATDYPYGDSDKSDLAYESADVADNGFDNEADGNKEVVPPLFKEFTPPIEVIEAKDEQKDEDDTLKTERTMLSPTIDAAEKIARERDSQFTVIDEDMPLAAASSTVITEDGSEGTLFDFGDSEPECDGAEEFSEEEEPLVEEIPPEKQNPDVIKMRELFPFLNEESEPEEDEETSLDYEDNGEDDYGELSLDGEIEAEEGVVEDVNDEPPFDMPTVKESAKTATTTVPDSISGLVAPLPKEEPKKPKKPDYSSYVFPPIELLGLDEERPDEDIQQEIQDNADKLIDTLASFNVTASIKGVDRGPRITRYEVVPARGVKTSSVMNLQDDIALNLAAGDIRMEAPIPGKSAIGIEIPNKKPSTVRLRELIEAEEFVSSKSKTTVCIGKDVAGQPVFSDISNMPHLLVAGATGMGKSVCINALMISILYKARPDEVKFIMIDPKQVEFTMYNGIPHLLVPVVSDAKQAAGSLMWAVEEMERRYNLLNPLCVRNIDAYNDKVTKDPSLGEPMSRIIIVIDEFADLMAQVKDPVENLVMRIAQKARAAGIHLIIGTQRPSVDVITGVIKANIPTRFSCKVASNRDSGTVLDSAGAEKLLNKGDMLLKFANSTKPTRVQGAFVADGEVEDIMAHIKAQGGASYDDSVMEEIKRQAQKCNKKNGSSDDDDDGDGESGEGYLNDRQFLDAVEVAVNAGKISTSLIQRKISIGYGKAAKFIDIMESMGIVSEPNGQKPRDVLISADEWYEKLSRISLD